MRQQRHTDFYEFNMPLNPPEKPNSTIFALCDKTQLHFYVGPDKQLVTIDLNAGDCCFFAGDVIHAGAKMARAKTKLQVVHVLADSRYFCALDSQECS